LLGVNRQVYYRSIKSTQYKQAVAQNVIVLVREIRMIMPRLGGRKLYYMLRNELSLLKVGRDKLFRILRANHMLIVPKRSYHITTDSHHRFRKHRNLISKIEIEKPESVWVSDITYVGTRANPSYLALITDAYSKKVVGYDVSKSLSMEGSLRALEMAVVNRKNKGQALIHHSDRGLQYCSNEYQKILKQNEIMPSMTEKYDPYENAIAERINGVLKQEFGIARKIKDFEVKKELIKSAIKIYNTKRPHLSNHMLTPMQMHSQKKLKRKQYKIKNLNNDTIVQV
jgi:transposase InsO family protein